MANRKATVVVIDSGGRGAALVHKYSLSPKVGKIIAIPGNELMHLNSKKPVKIFPNLKTTSINEIIQICNQEKVDLIDVAQDNAVAAGLTDKLNENNFSVIGPTKLAGQIEWDKAWSREFMKKYNLPIPKYEVFNSQQKAIEFINKNKNTKWFIKASGLAEGKGVIPVSNKSEAIDAIKQMMKFGKSGKTFVIEEALSGEEFSMFAISDGKNYQIVGSAQDHKRLHDGDLGPNTGGVGCNTPALIITKAIRKQGEDIIKKTIRGLAKENRPYKGVLYLGGMVVEEKVFIIEFNARWGDPEAEILIPGLKNDLFEIGMSVSKGTLNNTKIKTDINSRIVVTGSLRPNIESKTRELFGLNDLLKMKTITFYGTRIKTSKGKFFVTNGRLFHIVASGKNIIEARKKAYEALSLLSIEGNNLHYRTDIGWRDVQRLRAGV